MAANTAFAVMVAMYIAICFGCVLLGYAIGHRDGKHIGYKRGRAIGYTKAIAAKCNRSIAAVETRIYLKVKANELQLRAD